MVAVTYGVDDVVEAKTVVGGVAVSPYLCYGGEKR